MTKNKQFYNEIDSWYKVNNRLSTQLDNIAFEFDLSYLQFSVLVNIMENECTTPTELTNQLLISRSSISRILNSLQKKKLVIKNHIIGDQRIVNLAVTTLGSEKVFQIKKELNLLAPDFFNDYRVRS